MTKTPKILRKFCFFSVCFLLTLVLTTKVLPTRSLPTRSQEPILSPDRYAVAESVEPRQLLDLGLGRYQEGKFLEAATLWERASDIYGGVYANLGDRSTVIGEAQTLNYLALAYQRLGRGEKAWESIENSLALLQSLEKQDLEKQDVENLSPKGLIIFAQALNARANLELARGQTEAALETWRQAEETYDRAGDETGKLGSQINRAQALQSLGQYRKARSLLERVGEQLQTQPDSKLKADSLRSLGVALQTVGDLVESKAILEQSWGISSRLNLFNDTGATLFSIGNIARDVKQYDVALNYYEEAEKLLGDRNTKTQVELNRLSLFVAAERWEEARSIVPQVQSAVSNLIPSRSSVYARVNLAESLIKIEQSAAAININSSQCSSDNSRCIADPSRIAQLLAKAIQEARELQDPRAEADSLNQLGNLYAQNRQSKEARALTQQALEIAQRIGADRITARAAWQLGRLLKEQGEIAPAISAYQIAFNTLQSLRGDLVAVNPEVQFNFKESVEPIYREFASLLLRPNASQADLKQARKTIEALQLAELDNFFRDACLDTQPALLDEIDTEAAVIYPIILSDRLEVILSLPNQTLRHYATPLSRQRVEDTIQELISSLNVLYSQSKRLQLSQQVYDWLVRPAERYLERSEIKTLVFIQDGSLRRLPMAALHDGDRYLLEKYSIAYSAGLQLFPQGLAGQKLNVLVAALTEARQGFSSLPGVEKELNEIDADFESETLLNPTFTRVKFQEKIDAKSFRIVHLATHGQFSSDPEKTFLLTWDGRINVKDFDRLFQKRKVGLLEPIELLVMSACQTAAGDNRATLGLAGFALRSGARSTIASLWSVNDQATADLMTEFYKQLAEPETSNISKAEALRQAQLAVLKNPAHNHPYFWSAFILVGNWL
ncbi:MAG: CHAT domain-containing protein [Oscillatoria sp. SIO1A7]|nr:CHAT domain-containing protein [Oscillatoria sp. SIO1A7]